MSKSLKKLIDINRLREFKNKLVGTGSAYVQTAAVDQTIAGTKTFSKPIAGSVTGSSGSCTGNAATATTATTAKSCTGNAASAAKLQTARTINGTSFNGTANITTANWGTARDITIADSTGDNTGEAVSVNGSAAVTLKLPATIKASLDGNAATATSATTAASATTATNATNAAKLGNIASSGYVQTGKVNQTIDGTKTFSAAIVGSVTGNAGSATKLATARTINGTSFNGTANITTANWGTARNISITDGTNTSTAVSVNGSADVSLNLPATIKANLTGNCSGSSGSCTGNAATATTATTAKSCTGNAASATKLATARSLWGNNFDGSAAITGAITGTPAIELMPKATTANNGGFLDFHYNQSTADYTSRIIESASGTLSINNVTITTGKVVTATTFNGALKGNVTGNCSGSSGSCTGNAATATTATTAKSCTGNAATANIATKATQDAAGNTITTTYATKAENNTKANNSEVVHKSGDETIAGTKTFSNGVLLTATNALMAQNNGYTLLLRNDGNITYLLMSDKGGVPGTWSEARPLAINNSTGECDINGNAASAMKLLTARTIALSGAATGTATGFDGSGNITIPVTALASSAIRAQWYAAYPDGPEAHNAMWGGRDITAAFNNGTVSANIANGTFKDIFPGDYITKQVTIPRAFADDGVTVIFEGGTYTVNWVIADCDYWINKGDTAMTAHHVAIVPQAPIFNARMHPTNTTAGGCAGSDMYRKIIPACARGIVHAFGYDHILAFRDGITNSMDISYVSSGIPQYMGTPDWWGEWVSVYCNLMSEKMVFGAPVCSAGAMDNTMATRQMSAFRLSERLINYNRDWWWLRDVVSSAYFAVVNGRGVADAYYASFEYGVRPFALLK